MSNDREALRAANRRFYNAMEQADADAMRGIWSTEEPVSCVHPNCQAIGGWDDVMESWRILFEEIAPWNISITEHWMEVRDGLGLVMCVERYQLPDGEQAGESEESASEGEDEVEEEEEKEPAAAIEVDDEPTAKIEVQEEETDDESEDEGEETEEDDGRRTVVATHVFRLEEGTWKLVHRHSSPFEESEESVANRLKGFVN
jgi:ketosteroid isomerase-like protein